MAAYAVEGAPHEDLPSPPAAAALKLINAVACALALAVPAAPIHAGGHEQEFQQAVQQYKAGRYSQAYGKFIALANHGDPDAAHIALFMHKYGPTLYGSGGTQIRPTWPSGRP